MVRKRLDEIREMMSGLKDAAEIYETAEEISQTFNGKSTVLVLGIVTALAAKVIHSASDTNIAAQALAMSMSAKLHDLLEVQFQLDALDDDEDGDGIKDETIQ